MLIRLLIFPMIRTSSSLGIEIVLQHRDRSLALMVLYISVASMRPLLYLHRIGKCMPLG